MSDPEQSKNEGPHDPFTFAKNDSAKISPLSSTNKENKNLNPSEKNIQSNNDIHINKEYDLYYEGKRTNELPNIKNDQVNNQNLEEINEDNNDMMGKYNYEQDEDFYYFINKEIPPQNFSEKLRNIKIKYNKLKQDIEKLKKENKKYNPNFVIKKYNLD